MRKKIVYLTIVAASFAVVMFGCAKVPQQELSAAKASLDSARVLEADKYVTEDFVAARDSLNAAITEIQKQKSANQLTRNFNRAKSLLASATTAAKNAGAKAQAEKQKVQAEVDALLTKATTLLGETKGLLPKAPKGKAALEAIGSELSAVDSEISEAQTLKSNGNLIGARDKANASNVKLDSIKSELNNAIEKTSEKSKKK
jgi:hypothetical protein